MDSQEVLNGRLDSPADILIPKSGNSVEHENAGCADLNNFENVAPGDWVLDRSADNYKLAEGSDGGHSNFSEDGVLSGQGIDRQPVDNSILTGDSIVPYQDTRDNDLNPENILLKDLDIYFDDVNTSLTVSRMVNDSVFKGMVNAIIEEANEKITSKDMHILCLNEKLHHYELTESNSQIGSSMTEMETEGVGQQVQLCSLDSCVEQIQIECLKVATVEQLQALKKSTEHLIRASLLEVNSYFVSGNAPHFNLSCEGRILDNLKKYDESNDALKVFVESVSEQVNKIFCLFEDSITEHKWTYSVQRELMSILIKDSVMGLQDEFERKLCEERKLLNNNFSAMFDEVRNLRKELDFVSRSLFSCELGLLNSQGSIENLQERNMAKIKDNHFLMPSQSSKDRTEVADSPQLIDMTKEQLITYFKAEITEMRRHHESVLQEKTEELFTVKRELLREKGSLPSRKDRDYEILRRSITEMVSKLDNFLIDSEKFNMAEDDYENSPRKVCNLPWKNQCLRELPSGKNESNECSSEKDIEEISCPLPEAEFSQKMDNVGWNVEDVKIDAELRDNVQKVFLRCWINETKNQLDFMDVEVKTIHEIYSTMLTGSFEESKSIINSMEMKHDEIKCLLESNLLKKEKTLHSEVEMTMKLQHELQSLSKLLEEKEDHVKEVEYASLHQKKQLDEVCRELSMLRDQKSKLDQLLSDSRAEIGSIKSELGNSINQVHQYEEKVAKLDDNLCVALSELNESENEKILLQNIVQQKQNQILTTNVGERMQREKMKSLIFSLLKMSESFDALEGNMLEKIQRNSARLEGFKEQIDQLMRQADILQGELSCCKQKLEIKSLNLQKAEAEVDLLGDEVDTLLNLLAKIYIVLEHYFPVLQHYPGVMEVLKLIKGKDVSKPS